MLFDVNVCSKRESNIESQWVVLPMDRDAIDRLRSDLDATNLDDIEVLRVDLGKSRLDLDDLSFEELNEIARKVDKGYDRKELDDISFLFDASLINEIDIIDNKIDLDWYTIYYVDSVEEVGKEYADISGLKHELYMNDAEEFFDYVGYAYSLMDNYKVFYDEKRGKFILL